jgi:hypothetical protein
MTKKKRITAGEFLAQLKRDPAWVAKKRREDAQLRREELKYARAEAPIVKDLRAAGSAVDSVWDLVNARKRKYPELVPVLLEHLGRDYPERVREGIARALVVKEARSGWRKLVRAFLAEENPLNPMEHPNEVKWALHLAIAAAADESVVEELIKLTVDRRHEYHRLDFVEALAGMKDPQARATVEELRGEADLEDVFKRLDKNAKRRRK